MLTLAYDGLVAYRRDRRRDVRTAGRRSRRERFPIPSPDGQDLRVQAAGPESATPTGRPSVPRTFRASLEDLFRRKGVSSYARIVGAPECAAHPDRRCDLSAGIVTDARPADDHDPSRREPDAGVPPRAGVPTRLRRHPPLSPFGSRVPPPGTGPYRFVSYNRRRGARLVRNDHFRAWSPDARPDGFADEIVVRVRDDQIDAQIAAVQRGAADFVLVDDGFGGPVDPARLPALKRRNAGQLYTNAVPELDYMFLNVRTPPFDDPRVRQALNYAVDRRAIADSTGGPDLAQPTCQILPPGFPNYEPIVSATRCDPGPGGGWTAPDLARARRLIGQSGTRGHEGHGLDHPLRASHRAVLRLAAAPARLPQPAADRPERRRLLRPHSTIRARAPRSVVYGWGADHAAPSNFMIPFTCANRPEHLRVLRSRPQAAHRRGTRRGRPGGRHALEGRLRVHRGRGARRSAAQPAVRRAAVRTRGQLPAPPAVGRAARPDVGALRRARRLVPPRA